MFQSPKLVQLAKMKCLKLSGLEKQEVKILWHKIQCMITSCRKGMEENGYQGYIRR